MRCPSCSHENPAGVKFCGECGAAFPNHCPQCDTLNPPRFKFCGECGAALASVPRPPTSSGQESDLGGGSLRDEVPSEGAQSIGRGAPEAERRQLTVMFCDLVGSTPLSERLDPEDLREVVRAYRAVSVEVIRRFEGHLAKYLGDGFLVYFGYPRAHEDDAQRAVRAGLEILAALPALNSSLRQTIPAMGASPLQARIGIHTGPVVVGEIGEGEYSERMAILGDTPNVAARLQEMAQSDSVVITSATCRLIQGFFQCLDLGLHTLSGISTPALIYQVVSESGVQSRLEATASTGLTRLVGREREVDLLLELWEHVNEGIGESALLSGEAGIGKSRLVQVLKERLAEEPHTWLECRCSPYFQNSALYPVIDRLQRVLQFTRDDSPEGKVEKLEGFLRNYSVSLPEVIPLFAHLLSVPLGEHYPPLGLTPQRQKQKTLEGLQALLLEMAAQQPVVLVVEDLHWVDPSTLELLNLLVDQGPTAPMFLLLTARPEFSLPWFARSHLTQITLGRLPGKQTEVMVERVAGGKALPAEVLQQVVTRTDGIPLFVEELTKMVMEWGLLEEREDRYELTGPLPPLAIPTTLQDSLMARLDRLATIKEVAQLGATLGREFTYELLHAVSPLNEATLQRELARLVDAEILFRRGVAPQATYIFKHALIQESAYQSLLKSTRQQYHQQIAQVLEERFSEMAETQPELLAHHYTEAGSTNPAIVYWKRAGERATARSANLEAIGHLTRGLELLKTLPNTPDLTRQELTLLIALGTPLQATKGFGAPEAGGAYKRACELCGQVGETRQRFPALWGLWVFHLAQVELQTARGVGEQLLTLAQRLQDPALLMQAHHALGPTLVLLGERASARAHLEQGAALYDFQQHGSHAFLYGGHDPGICCLVQGALALWMLGYPAQAAMRSHEALTLARELSHPVSLAHAEVYSACVHQFRREGRQTREHAEAAVAVSTQQGDALHLAQGLVLRGWALAEQGHGEDGIALIRQGLVAWQATGTRYYRWYFLAMLAELYGKQRQVAEGLDVLAEALAAASHGEERFYEPELYRLKGELLLALGRCGPRTAPAEAEAEACFRQATEIARRQGAKSLELRAVMSWSRLLQRRGENAAGRRMLAEIYNWFTEGFETPDLQEAMVLLGELSCD